MGNNLSTESEIRAVLESWAAATREGRSDDVLKNYAADLVIFDVLPPMKYESAETYRRSWDEWQPESQGEATFDLEDVVITAGHDVAFAFCFIRCAGTLPDGTVFHDLVRATFCLEKVNGSWVVRHQHISKPFEQS
ncbi:MAG: ketosteroid isomerase [Spirochaetaceae bacterium]|nr:MAG: ketosteroid isomerase [Spirochaetaceae bacterium]